jgi:hypothetical protein
MLSTSFPQPPSLHPSSIFLRSLKKSISLVQPVLCARFLENPPTSLNPAQKVFFDTPFSSRKTGFLRAPYQWTSHILRNHCAKKVAAQKKLTRPSRGVAAACPTTNLPPRFFIRATSREPLSSFIHPSSFKIFRGQRPKT